MRSRNVVNAPKEYFTGCQGHKQKHAASILPRVVATSADVGAGVEVRAALTDDDFAGEDLLAAEALHAEALCVGVTTVTGGACALFVCHV